MLFGTLRFISKGWIAELYINPKIHFPYLGFSWVKVLPGEWMYLPFILLVFACIGIILGAFYRLSSIVFFILFTYIELLDKTYYLNHYYFVSLIGLLFIFLPANRNFSFDAYRSPEISSETCSFWAIWIIRFQLGVVYFFAGVAKINSDWLFQAQPLKIWLQAHRDLPIVGSLFATSWLAFVFSWFSCIYDLTIPFLLSWKKSRKLAYLLVVVFHIITWLLFPIGVFPWVMIFSTLIFFSDSFHLALLRMLEQMVRYKSSFQQKKPRKSLKWTMYLIGVYVFIQIALPFRYVLYPGNLFWKEEAFRFSWRVMLMHKEGNVNFYVRDKASNQEIEIDNTHYLTAVQIDQMATQPDFILQYAKFLKKEFNDTLLSFGNQSIHLKDPSIHAESYVSLNGRPAKKMISKKHDLTQITYNFAPRTWVEPF